MATVLVSLTDPAATNPALAGQKAAVLARLLQEGFSVPEGLVLTTDAVAQMTDAEGKSPQTVFRLSGEIRSSVAVALEQFGDAPLAVRSSGVAEDLAGASFAGQYETVLDVRGIESVSAAISTCIASAFSERVSRYEATVVGTHGSPAPLAVLIQRLVHADAAGVAFSANPVTGERAEAVVNAVRGLGERLVSGEALPDAWLVRGDSAACQSAAEKAIDGEQALRIAELARRVEAALGAPQDIEWAIAAGETFLLQARPITALPVVPTIVPPAEGYWMKDDSHFPGPITPFGASVYLPALVNGMKAMCAQFGLLVEEIDHRAIGGEVYARVVPLGGKDRPAPPWWVLAIAARLVPELRRHARIADQALNEHLVEHFLQRWQSEWRDELTRKVTRLRSDDLTALTSARLLEHLDAAIELLGRGEEIHFSLWPGYVMAMYELARVCKEALGWSAGDAFALLSGTSGASSEPGRAMSELARMVASNEAAGGLIQEAAADVQGRLREEVPEVEAALADYIERFGHRTTGYDPGEPTLAERPELIIGLLRDQVNQVAGTSHRNRAGGEDLLARARQALASHADSERGRFEDAFAFAERYYPVREENIFYTDIMPNAVIRYALLEIGRRLVLDGRLLKAEDAAYLADDELRAGLQGGSEDLRAKVALRRAERAWVLAHPGPLSYGTESAPPALRGLPRSLRYLMEIMLWTMEVIFAPPAKAIGDILRGTPGSAGTYTGAVRVIRGESEFDRLRPGEVLVCPTTSPSWSVLFPQVGALVTDGGGVLSHAAVIAREYGIPAVLGTGNATTLLRDGLAVTVDGTSGTVSAKTANL